MAVVRFNRPEEFIEELRKDRELVPRRVVYLTLLVQPAKVIPIRYLSVVGTAEVGFDVYRLERYCGDLWDFPQPDGATKAAADQVMQLLQQELTAIGFCIRSGVLGDL